MALKYSRPYGTEDVTPKNINKWKTVENDAKKVAESYGFREIRVPTFETTDLFLRSVGETTDVVQKEMYTVKARESEFTLRPEGTAGTIRAILQNGMLNDALPQKVYYILSCFRHERPQAGRLREFHQFGLEMAGSSSPRADFEVISLARDLINELGLKNIKLNINSIGCPECRPKYYAALKEYFEDKKDMLCDDCKSRLEKNPMRILDCKKPDCREAAKNAPLIVDYLCDDCKNHFELLKKYLTESGTDFEVNPKIVRGLDYYTKTVFEFTTDEIGAQGTVAGGGRYDGLIEQLGGKPTPALGFGMGIERVILLMEKQKLEFIEPTPTDLYIVTMDEASVPEAMKIAKELRNFGYCVEYDLMDRSFKSQMKYANKINASFIIVLGENEIKTKDVKIKNMRTGDETPAKLGKDFAENFETILFNEVFRDYPDMQGDNFPDGMFKKMF